MFGREKSLKKTCLLISAALLLSLIIFAAIPLISAKAASPNAAPIAKEMEYKTYEGVSVSGECSAIDPEGDKITFAVSRDPKKGTVDIEKGGKFVYTPTSGQKGKDTFNYVAIDSNGNISADATVTVLITGMTVNVSYSDLEGSDIHYEALRLAEKGIFVGSNIGGEYRFYPDAPVTRSEFLLMCLKLCDIEVPEDITMTGFSDDDEIASWLKPYVSAAVLNDIVTGYSVSGDIFFYPDNTITMAEAIVALDNAMDITDTRIEAFASQSCPAWASQSDANLRACGILTGSSIYDEPMTRADAAKLLSPAIDVLEAR